MKANRLVLKQAIGVVVAGAFCIFSAGPMRGQAAPGPLSGAQPVPPSQAPTQPQAQPKPASRKNILGSWRLNRDDSDTPQRGGQRSSGGGGNGGNGPYGGRGRVGGWPFPGGGGPGGGNGPYGGPRGGNGGRDDDAREEMREVMRPAASLTFAQKDKEFDLTDDQGHKRAFFTDGRKLQKSKDESYQEIAAQGDSTHLVSDEKSPRGGKLSRTFELSPDGTQLYETIQMDSSRSYTPARFRYVYDATGETEQR